MSRISVDELRELIEAGADPVRDRRALRRRPRHRCAAHPRRASRSSSAASRELGELPRDREIVIYCNCPNEASAASAARLLAERGLTRVRPLAGGLEAWVAAGQRIESHGAAAGAELMESRWIGPARPHARKSN